MTWNFPPDSLTFLPWAGMYHLLWRVFQYRQRWILQHQAGHCLVLMLPSQPGETPRFLEPGDLLAEGPPAQASGTGVPLTLEGVSSSLLLVVRHPLDAMALLDSLLDGEGALHPSWASRTTYPLTAKWFGISFHAPGTLFSPAQPTGQGSGHFAISSTTAPDHDGTAVLGCFVVDVVRQAPLSLAEGSALLIRHESRRAREAHQEAALACIESLQECMRAPHRP